MKLPIILGLFLSCGSASMASLATGTGEQLLYDVYLDDTRIGYHKVVIRPEASRKIVEVEAEFKVKFLLFTAYAYQHRTHEEWQDNCLVSITSQTNDNGERFSVNGNKQDGEFKVKTDESSQKLTGCVKTFAYWDPKLLKANYLLNTQTGVYTPVETRFIGMKNIDIGGKTISANHYRIESRKFDIDLWYSNNMEWLALSTATENGANLRYIRQL